MMIRATLRAAVALWSIGLSACVTLPPNAPRSPQDPWESWNRGVYRFNDSIDRHALKPVAKGYVKVVPKPVRSGVSNFFSNLETTTVLVNDILQLKFKSAANDLGRFVMNSTVGLGGVLDPATAAGLAKNDEDFGQTLGHYGVPAGPFVELPLFGPSDVRDASGRVVDSFTDLQHYIKNNYVDYGLDIPKVLDVRAALLSLDPTLQTAFDPYALLRDAYLQRRAYLVSDGKTAEAPLEDPGADEPAPKP